MFVYQRIVWRFQLQTMSINTKKSARYVTRLDNSWRGSGSVEFAVLHTERRADRGYITLATFVGHLRQNLFKLRRSLFFRLISATCAVVMLCTSAQVTSS